MLRKHESAGRKVLAEMEKRVEEGSDFVVSCGTAFTDEILALKEDTQRTLREDLYGVPSLKTALAEQTAEVSSGFPLFTNAGSVNVFGITASFRASLGRSSMS